MSPKAQRIAIAEVLSWHSFRDIGGDGETRLWGMSAKMKATSLPTELVPDFLTDLNAIHAAEKVLTREQQKRFIVSLIITVGPLARASSPVDWENGWYEIHATAAQRAEAFLRCLNLWTP